VDVSGREIGTHRGACFYTVGQRKGLGVAAREPLYVIGIDARSNEVVLGSREDALSRGMIVSNPNWIGVHYPSFPFRCLVQIRHKHVPTTALTDTGPDGSLKVVFDHPQFGVAPGQAAVFYDGETVVGGGWIKNSL
jgi:tRNA-specific 2-thiouridylase